VTAFLEISRRKSERMGYFRKLKVAVDDEVVAQLKPGESVTVQVSPGLHSLEARMDWEKSAPCVVNLADDGSAVVEARAFFWSSLLSNSLWSKRALEIVIIKEG
jgi:hypothetical protein